MIAAKGQADLQAKLEYIGFDGYEEHDLVDHYFCWTEYNLVTLTVPTGLAEKPSSVMQISETRDSMFGKPRPLSDAFTLRLLHLLAVIKKEGN